MILWTVARKEIQMLDVKSYDCTADVLKHRALVKKFMTEFFAEILSARGEVHDESKLHTPEKEVFDEYRPKLDWLRHGSAEYEAALKEMGEGLAHHYRANRHHPQHFENGISGMTLIDVIEMFCDWCASAQEKGVRVDLEYSARRFGLAPQLVEIFLNTLNEIDFVGESNGVPVPYLSPASPK